MHVCSLATQDIEMLDKQICLLIFETVQKHFSPVKSQKCSHTLDLMSKPSNVAKQRLFVWLGLKTNEWWTIFTDVKGVGVQI